ncbi:hypothetical protein F0P93_26830, partial [Larkinella humicola]
MSFRVLHWPHSCLLPTFPPNRFFRTPRASPLPSPAAPLAPSTGPEPTAPPEPAPPSPCPPPPP